MVVYHRYYKLGNISNTTQKKKSQFKIQIGPIIEFIFGTYSIG